MEPTDVPDRVGDVRRSPVVCQDVARGSDRSADDARKSPRDPVSLTLSVNGRNHHLALDARTTLLDALRERLGLTGAKRGCDHGQCGACTVLIDGRRVLSCLTLALVAEGNAITTIEGLAKSDGTLHPMQQAFIDQDAFQCGYCTPGQILSAVSCVQDGHAGNDAEIREYMPQLQKSGTTSHTAVAHIWGTANGANRPAHVGRR